MRRFAQADRAETPARGIAFDLAIYDDLRQARVVDAERRLVAARDPAVAEPTLEHRERTAARELELVQGRCGERGLLDGERDALRIEVDRMQDVGVDCADRQ